MKNEVILVTGQRGQGKTTYIKNQISLYSRVIIFDLLGEFTYYDTDLNLRDFFKSLSKAKEENFFVLNYYNPKNSEDDFHVICEAMNRLKNIMFIVDEIDYFCSTHSIPKQFDEIVKRGRHQGLQLMVATRRPHEIPPIIRSQVTKFITFRHIEPIDLDYIKDLTGINPDEVQGLPNFSFIKWEEGKISKGIVTKLKTKQSKKIDIFEETKSKEHNLL